MADLVLKPKEQEMDPATKKADALQFENLEEELRDSAETEGQERVDEAVAEVNAGVARPEALLAWIDDLKEAEERQDQHQQEENLERSFAMDFVPDSAREGAASEIPQPEEYLFSANRRASDVGDDGDDGGGGGGGGGNGGGEGDGEGGEGDGAPKDKPNKGAGDVAKTPAKKADKADKKKSDKPADKAAPAGKPPGKPPGT